MDSPAVHSGCDLTLLLQGLRHLDRPRLARLFACACCRRFWPPEGPVARTILAGSEGLADGLNSTLLLLALDEAYPLPEEAPEGLRAACWTALPEPHDAAARVALLALRRGPSAEAEVCRIFRDIFGRPAELVAGLEPGWLARHRGVIQAQVALLYDSAALPDGAFDRVAIAQLTRLLGQAGCADRRLFGHLAGAAAHHRGCWALDWLLGREGAAVAAEASLS